MFCAISDKQKFQEELEKNMHFKDGQEVVTIAEKMREHRLRRYRLGTC